MNIDNLWFITTRNCAHDTIACGTASHPGGWVGGGGTSASEFPRVNEIKNNCATATTDQPLDSLIESYKSSASAGSSLANQMACLRVATVIGFVPQEFDKLSRPWGERDTVIGIESTTGSLTIRSSPTPTPTIPSNDESDHARFSSSDVSISAARNAGRSN